MKKYTTLKRNFKELSETSTQKPEYQLSVPEFTLLDSFESNEFIGFEARLNNKGVSCKQCGHWITRIKDTKESYCHYDLIGDKPVLLKLLKTLYFCSDCAVSTIARSEKIETNAQKSKKIIELTEKELIQRKETYSEVARRYKLSVSNVIVHFDKMRIAPPEPKKVRVISIDEVRFIQEIGAYQCVISDALTGEIIEILENRLQSTLLDYLKKNLSHVSHVTQDFWATYRTCAEAIGATISVDKFHFVRFAIWSYGRTRVGVQKSENIRLMKSWKLQNKSRKNLSKAGKRKLDRGVLSKSSLLTKAYKAKEWFLHLTRVTDIQEFREGLSKWRENDRDIENNTRYATKSIFTCPTPRFQTKLRHQLVKINP